jgi:3-dehydroquinate synthetase
MGNESVLELNTGLKPASPIYFGEGIAGALPHHLARHCIDRCFLVTSRRLMELHGTDLKRHIDRARVACSIVLIEESEANKGWHTLRSLCERLTRLRATKDSAVVSLGGGVVGNIAGLAAAMTYRGIRFVEVPTTVMAMTDGCLSNKQAINGRCGKNHFGVYHAPLFIWADALYPQTEPPRQQRSGVVEGVKNVLIAEGSPDRAEQMIALFRRPGSLADLLLLLIGSKLPILARDPTERSYGVVLEYGHTFGHAIEWLARGALYHGEAVAIGMCAAAELSHDLGYASRGFVDDHYRLLGHALGTATKLPEGLTAARLYQTMLHDNKKTGRGIRYVLLRGCGRPVDPDGDFTISVAERDVLGTLAQLERSPLEATTHA